MKHYIEMLLKFLFQPKENKSGNMTTALLSILISPVLIVLVVFSPSSTEDQDNYDKAFNEIGCPQESSYLLEDIRAFDSYVDQNIYMNISKSEARDRLDHIYLNVANKKDKKKCYLKSDAEITKSLKQKYNLKDEQIEEMLINVKAVRNGRQTLVSPLEKTIIISQYQDDKDYTIFSSDAHAKVKSIGEGTVKNIYTSNDHIEINGNSYSKGLIITVEYEIQKGVKEAQYITEKIEVEYSMLTGTTLNVGDKIKEGQQISKLLDSYLFLKIKNSKNEYVDPEEYIFLDDLLPTGQYVIPFKTKPVVVGEVGERDLVTFGTNFHYGMDLSVGAEAEILAFTDGEVVRTSTNCAPFGGYIGNNCPFDGIAYGGGNYVIISFEDSGKKYYGICCHMSKVKVHTGDKVRAGDVIGTQGSSGTSLGTHMHLEIHEGTYNTNFVGQKKGLIDPRKFIDFQDGKKAQTFN